MAGVVYVHQYQRPDTRTLQAYTEMLTAQVDQHVSFPADNAFFALGPGARRLRMKSRSEIAGLFSA